MGPNMKTLSHLLYIIYILLIERAALLKERDYSRPIMWGFTRTGILVIAKKSD